MEDVRITEMFHSRCENAVDELLKKYGRLLKSVAINVLRNEEDAEECVNDACLAIWNAIPPAKPESLMAFSCKIVRRTAINRLRFNTRQKRDADSTLPLGELEECISITDGVAEHINSEHLNRVLNDFVSHLSGGDKAIFVRRYFLLESVNEIAERFGISENRLSVKLHRLRKKLAVKLKEEGVYE